MSALRPLHVSQAPEALPVVTRPLSTDAADDAIERAEQLAAALQERDDLLAVVGHELRNPLHALTLQLTLARHSAKSSHHDETVARIDKSQRMLARYVDRVTVLFELIRSPTQDIHFRPVDTDLSVLIRSIGDGLMPEADYRGVQLQVEAPETCPVFIDPQFVEQMVDNLLINAFKHAAARKVTLKLHAPSGPQATHVRIDVADDGRGVAEADRERIFTRSGVGQNSHRGTGTGLGLWIVTRLASAFGGSVALRDGPEGGSLFTLDIPLSVRHSVRSPTDQ